MVGENERERFRERMNNFEIWADEMLTDFADALALVESISLPQFEPDWRIRLLKVGQHLYRIPRQIFPIAPDYVELEQSYRDFAAEADAIGEDLLEFLISIEKHDLEDAADLHRDLREGLERLETMLTTRWRKIAQLTRIIPVF